MDCPSCKNSCGCEYFRKYFKNTKINQKDACPLYFFLVPAGPPKVKSLEPPLPLSNELTFFNTLILRNKQQHNNLFESARKKIHFYYCFYFKINTDGLSQSKLHFKITSFFIFIFKSRPAVRK